MPAEASGFTGSYAITEGVFNPWLEVAPVDEDFYHLFYDPSIRPEIVVFDLAVEAERVTLTLNQNTVLHAWLDGRWRRDRRLAGKRPR